MKQYEKLIMWILIVGGLLWGYEGVTGVEFQEQILGNALSNLVEIVVGISAVISLYWMVSAKKKRK